MVRTCVLLLPLLAFVARPIVAVRHNLAAQANSLTAQAQETNSSAFFCPAICVPCAYGDKTVFIARSKGMVKKALDIGVVALAASGIGSLWGMVAGAVGLSSYAAADHYVAHEIADECPTFELRYFEGEEYLVAPADVHQLLDDEDKSPMFLWKKSISKLYKAETGQPRRYGQLPPSLKAMLDKADFMCGNNGGAVHLRMKEQGTVNGMFNWITGDFESNCQTLHKEYHSVVKELEEMEEPTEDVTEIHFGGGGLSTPVDRVDDRYDDFIDENEEHIPIVPTDEDFIDQNEEHIAVKPTDQGGKNTGEEDLDDEYEEHLPSMPEDQSYNKPTLVVERADEPSEEDIDPEEVEETYYLDGSSKTVEDDIKGLKEKGHQLISSKNAPYNMCRLLTVGAFGCKLVPTDGICQCKYLAAQKCENWFPYGATLRVVFTNSDKVLLMAKNLCQCYGTSRSTYGCSFGVLDHVPNVAIAK